MAPISSPARRLKPLVAAAVILLAASACRDAYEADPLYAARADSSAAGYVVGIALADATDSTSQSTRPRRDQPDRSRTQARTDSGAARPSGDDRATGPARTTAQTGSGSRDSAANRTAATRDTTATRADSSRQVVAAADSARADSTSLPPGHVAVTDDSVVVNQFLAYDPGARMVWLDLIAGFDAANGSLNFNGGFEGAQTIVIPVGWRVEVRFQNRDRELAHSAIVVRAVDPIPMIAPPAAFPNAFTLSLEEGLIEGRSDVVRFSADTEGRYTILCAVPGHGQSGMWVRLQVVATARAPSYQRR